jgi:hypothetical protein
LKKWAYELNREFPKKGVQMASKYTRKCSISLAIKEMQIRTLRLHLTPIRMARIKGNSNNRMWQNRNPYTLLVGIQISTTTMESSTEIPQKTRDRTAI